MTIETYPKDLPHNRLGLCPLLGVAPIEGDGWNAKGSRSGHTPPLEATS